MTPAIALFLKAPHPGSVKTRLAADIGRERATELYRELTERTAAVVRRMRWPVTVWYTPATAEAEMRAWLGDTWRFRPQPEGDLGARLAHAVAACPAGRSRLLLGADCPGLDAGVLEAARAALERVEIVIGPSEDGGYYLLGGRCPFPDLFSGMPWSTDVLLDRTWRRARELGLTWEELSTLRDVDTEQDARELGLIP